MSVEPMSPVEVVIPSLPPTVKDVSIIDVEEQTSQNFLENLETQFQIDDTSIIESEFYDSFQRALSTDKRISMIPTNITIPDSIDPTQINGEFLCLDVGGSTIRIGLVQLSPEGVKIIKQEQWLLLSGSKKIVDSKFFDELTQKALNILRSASSSSDLVNIGITWSFPLNKENVIITMGKGFHITSEVQNRSIDSIIEKSFANRGVTVNIRAVINDSIAVNLAGLLDSSFHSKISLIIGTGLNSCISLNSVLINTELGFFGKLYDPTVYDLMIDQRWDNDEILPYIAQDFSKRIFQPLEFLCSSRYVCELFRLIILDLINDSLISIVNVPEFLTLEYELHGSFFVLFEAEDHKEIKERTEKKYQLELKIEDIILLKRVTEIILDRSSKYLTASLKALQKIINERLSPGMKDINVNFVGSFLSHSEQYQRKIVDNSKDLKITLKHVDDSSVIGAAVAAALIKTL